MQTTDGIMNERRWEKVRRVLADCLGRPDNERQAAVDEHCGSDAELRREVDSLLEASRGADAYFDSLAGRTEALALGDAARSGIIGSTVGHFDILDTLGSGGMGDVYRARDRKLGRDVALKLLGGSHESDAVLTARFEREAMVLAALNHPNIAAIYGREEFGGRPILVLELVEGRTLTQILDAGPMPLDEVMRAARQMAGGLGAAHDKGIVHRDLKPSNVMVTADGRVKILDFGIAKPAPLERGGMASDDLTATGMLIGTAPYMSPEQVRGQELDPRTDIWAFGCLLFEMLTGFQAFERDTIADTLAAIIEHEPRCELLPDETPAALTDLIRLALKKKREDRLDDVGVMQREIEALLTPTGELSVADVQAADELQRARDYIEEHCWQEAFELLAPRADELGADDLANLSRASWWTGHLDQCIEADERAFSMFLAESRPVEAAETALSIADHYSRRLEDALRNGWLARAERLLEGQPESSVHGWVLRARIMRADADGRYDDAIAGAREMLDIGNRLGDRDLQALAIHYEGRTRLKQGETEDGMALVDEATVAAISGELSPMATAVIYCNAISACRLLADYRRAGEWTAAAKRWCERQAIAGFPGICRVYRAEVMRLHGHWTEAEKEASKAYGELETFAPSVARVALHELGEIRLRLGDLQAAREAFNGARQLGKDPQPGASLLLLAEGDADGAANSIKRALDGETTDRLARTRLLPVQIEIALERSDLDTARAACRELHAISGDFDAPAVRAAARHACGAVHLAAGEIDKACRSLREAIRFWEQANVPYEAARARELCAQAYLLDDDVAGAELELQAACRTFVQLGAVPDSRRAASLLADQSIGS